MNPLAIAAACIMALSLLGNAGLTWAYLGARDTATAAGKDRDQAHTAAQTCSDSVDALQLKARDQADKAKKDIAAATARARTRDQRADSILATPASVPGNDCQSAGDRVNKWLKDRK